MQPTGSRKKCRYSRIAAGPVNITPFIPGQLDQGTGPKSTILRVYAHACFAAYNENKISRGSRRRKPGVACVIVGVTVRARTRAATPKELPESADAELLQAWQLQVVPNAIHLRSNRFRLWILPRFHQAPRSGRWQLSWAAALARA